MSSVWEKKRNFGKFNELSGDINTDILIIGGGIAGLLCAYKLHQQGADYVLVEKGEICSGVTENTTAKITAQHGLIYTDLLRRFGKEYTKLYLEANLKAVEDYRSLCKNIDCDFENENSFVYSILDQKKIKDEINALKYIGFDAKFKPTLPLPVKTAGAVCFLGQAQFNPLKFLGEISRGLNIYEHTKVLEMKKNVALTSKGKINAKRVIIATHFPFLNKHGAYFLKMFQHRSYVLGLENAQQVDGIYIDEQKTGLSFRNYGDLLLLGGGSHRTGKKGGGYKELEAFARKNYPNAKIKYRFATQDCMTLDDVAYIGRYSPATPDLFVTTGFNKWGMTTALLGAELLCDMLCGKRNPYEEIFSPRRSIFRPQLAVNAFETVTNLLTPTTPRCPHLGCALKWNKEERSWDCSCHGSRFDEKGRVLNNPATDDLKI
ncbi:MAG: FAD-dependent oxidoreductase [Clostridia bacterium]|nr:FAD-dependent oxidoreductase [Clostridia bacterium]